MRRIDRRQPPSGCAVAKRVRPSAGFLVMLAFVAFSFGCWEQVSPEWFPQMKRQLAVQAYEEVTFNDQVQGFTPPDDTVPLGWAGVPDLDAITNSGLGVLEMEALQSEIPNPNPPTLASLQNGQVLFERYCATCHGKSGMGNGPVAYPNGPFFGVLPMVVANARKDGHVYATISLGRRNMPAYARISPSDRWDIVNYIRDLNGNGGPQ